MKQVSATSRPPRSTRLSDPEKCDILALDEEGLSVAQIAIQLGRARSTVARFLGSITNTRDIAKATLLAGAAQLAERVIEQANATESLDVLDRLDLLPNKRADTSHGGTTVIVGMPKA